MDPELEAYDTAWNTSTERNAVCQQLADAYVAAHPELAERRAVDYVELSAAAEQAMGPSAWSELNPDERRIYLDVLAIAAGDAAKKPLRDLTIPSLVALVDAARAAGNEGERIELDIWINFKFEYQTIGGYVDTSGTPRELPAVNVHGDSRDTGGL